ncbi:MULTISPECIES: copper-containing nitrite reductase [Shewanella]|uniref:copper-containing nitrite reductase n=1 Tax=Shewanella TaxID=22 RepID=UPI001EFCB0C4|nr:MULTISPECIES: copper-containing nitrite reductase [Shewanella]MCG9719985.1 copper-containing nitrite reductase [Shewanella sp. Isolate7]MCG9745087.1 copper-containing nitrite reductase [Shewanella sp. Isolate8]MCL2909951.1 copper-containing nitrite reductase [Shewanella aquimarina]
MKKQSSTPAVNVDQQRRSFLSGSVGLGIVGAGMAAGLVSGSASATTQTKSDRMANYKADQLERVTQELVPPPMVPKHDQVAKGKPKVVQVKLVVEEKQIELENGTKAWVCAFNGSVPGPLIVCHQHDFVELTLVNPASNALAHNIDLHAATGALGGGELTLVSPGQEVTFRFKATKAGTFVYHCAPGGVMIPWHVAMGMHGAIMVLPREGLTDAAGKPIKYDKAYYIGEADFYVPKDAKGKYKAYDTVMGSMNDVLEVMKTLTPSHVVFNGGVGALTGKNAMTAKVGESVLFIHSQANRDTRPHIIGGHGDYVWPAGSFTDAPQTNLETWMVAGGSACAALYNFRQPGLYAYVNHNLIEAIMKGAAAHIKVDGEWDDNLMVQIKKPSSIATA